MDEAQKATVRLRALEIAVSDRFLTLVETIEVAQKYANFIIGE